MKRFALLMLVMVCLSLTAFAADVPAGDVFGGFSIFHAGGTGGTTFYGWGASGAYNVHKMVGIVADFGGTYKTVSGVSLKQYNYVFGPRFNFRQDKVTYFGEALYGEVHGTAGTLGSVNEFAMAYGGGVDVKAGKKVMIRVIEFDWVPIKNKGTGAGWDNKGTRYLFGVDFPFGKK